MPTNLFGLVVGIAIGLLLALMYFMVWKARYTANIRQDAVQRSQAVTAGKVYEQLTPYLLTPRERCVRDVIYAGDIEWAELRVPRPFASGAA